MGKTVPRKTLQDRGLYEKSDDDIAAGIAEPFETVLLIEVVNILFAVIVMGSTFLTPV